jgi:hypothetical protein
VILREYLRHIIVSVELSLMELSEHPFREVFLNCFGVYLCESYEGAVVPLSVSNYPAEARTTEIFLTL